MKQYIALALCLLFIVFGGVGITHALSVPAEDAFRGIVRIYTYIDNKDGHLELRDQGNGIVLQANGLVLTTLDTVMYEDQLGNSLPVAVNICVTDNKNELPTCDYAADIVSKNTDLGLALLQMRSTPAARFDQMNYIKQASDDVKVIDGETIYAWGYENGGSGIVDHELGKVSGRKDILGNTVFTVAVDESFQVRAGAMVNEDGELVGLTRTNTANPDASYFEALSYNVIRDWVESHTKTIAAKSSLADRLDTYLKHADWYDTGRSLKENYINLRPHFELTRPSNWVYTYDDETSLDLKNGTNENGGSINVQWVELGVDAQEKLDDFIEELQLQLPQCNVLGNKKVGTIESRHVKCEINEEEINYYIVPIKNYIITFTFHYGEAYADWDPVNNTLGSVKLDENAYSFNLVQRIERTNPKFVLQASDDWGLTEKNSFEHIVSGQKKDQAFSVQVQKLTTAENNASNRQYFNMIAETEATKLGLEKTFDTVELYEFVSNYKVNSEFPSVIRYAYKAIKNDEQRKFMSIYRIRYEGKVYIVNYSYLGWDEGLFIKERTAFEENVLASFSIKEAAPVEEIVEEQQVDRPYEFVHKDLEGTLIKGSSKPAVYLLKDGKRYVFPNERIFYSWFSNFDSVQEITDAQLAQYGLGGNLTFRPGTLIKIPSLSKVYVIEKENEIRWIESEETAKRLFGTDWAKKVRDVGASYFLNYKEIESLK